MLYTRIKPRKRKPNWRNILLTLLCVVLLATSVTLLVKSIPAWVRPGDVSLENSPTPPTPGIDPTVQPYATPTATPEVTPAPEITPEPTEAPTPTPKRGSGVQSITIGAVGDVKLHEHALKAAKSGNSYDFTNFFGFIQPYISWQDVVIADLDAAVAEGTVSVTRAPAALLDGLSAAGVDVVTLANATVETEGAEAAEATVLTAAQAGLTAVGSEGAAPVILEKDDLRIALLNYAVTEAETAAVHELTDVNLTNDLAYLGTDPLGVDFVIVCIDWNLEDGTKLTDLQKEWVKKLSDAGVDVVLGSGTQVPQAMTTIQNAEGHKTLVAHGLGNFLSGYRKDGKDAGVIVNFTLTKDFDNETTSIDAVSYAPTWVLKYSAQGKYSFEIMPAAEYADKHYRNMAKTDKERIAKVPAEIENAVSTSAGSMDKTVRKMVDGVSTVVMEE